MPLPLLFTLAVFVAVYIGLITERFPRHIVVLCGTLALLVAKILTVREALAYINGQTILWLLSLFIIIEALSIAGLFEWLARLFTRRFAEKPTALFFILPLLTGSMSMAVNNITVMVFMTSLTLTICQYVPLEPVPLLIGEVACANMMGAATLIGAPPNLVMATTLGYTFNRVAIHMAPIVFICTAIFMLIYYRQYRRTVIHNRHPLRPLAGDPSLTLTDSHSRTKAWHLFLKIDYETLVFFVGLFVLVGALEHVGLFRTLAQSLSKVQNPLLLMFAVLWGSAIVSAFVDNVPMALAMAYLIKQLSATSPTFPSGILVWAALVGLTLGGNVTPIGASPNIVAYGILEKQNIRIGWKKWASMTVPGTMTALLAASALLWAKFRMGWY